MVTTETPFTAMFVSSAPVGPDDERGSVLVVRRRSVGNGLCEEVTLINTTGRPASVRVDLLVEADFADLFEVKDGRVTCAASPRMGAVHGDELEFSALREAGEYAVRVVADASAGLTGTGVGWTVELAGHGTWRRSLEVRARLFGVDLPLEHTPDTPVQHALPYRRHRDWHQRVPRLHSADSDAALTLRRSMADLGSLRIFDPARPELPVVAAGAPWFMALFGRDSLLTSIMTLPVDAALATGTAATLAAHQGETYDVRSEEEPGRILHEIRFGPAGTLALGGTNAYYGSADATPLFVMLLGELLRWCGPEAVGPELVGHADRALDWMLKDGDPDGDGFIEYARKHEGGLLNQGWKDSWDGVNFADGTMAEAPIALAEVQGYAYAAYLARAAIARADADDATARRWEELAAELKRRFNDAFWLPDRGWFAIALDRDKRPVDALTSNIGHCLWTGIVDDDKAASVCAHLTSPEMFSGWGVRTLATSMAAYNPLSYHNGSVWPHDTAICAAGLARYGFREEAALLARGILEASAFFDHRLPELFGGFAREQVPAPVPYPAACSPQAWAAAARVELLRNLLGLEPDDGRLRCDPASASYLLPLRLSNVLVSGRRHVVEVDAAGTVTVIPGPRTWT
jgi:glycogen debranching enzyme